MVPRKTTLKIEIRSQLLTIIPVFLLEILCKEGLLIFSDFNANNKNEELRIMNKNIKMNKPLPGSEANVCTEFKTPDLTRKVPAKLSENVRIARIIVQDCIVFLLCRTTTQCIKAVAESQGISEAFSTGSQNQYPPHPNS